ncbi:anaerobic dehydrogenase [Pseudomonas putida]|nr:anaerobic dehydrogenase [Pseudomonas putida]
MAKWSPEWLDGTLGFYYRNTSDPTPAVLINAPNLHTGSLEGTSYMTAYADDIDIYGISLAKSVGPVSVGLDVNYRENMPLISNFTTINGPLNGALAGTAGGTNLIGEVPGHGETGLARGKTLHVVLNGLVSFGATPLWNASSLAVEGAMTHLVSVDKGEQTFKGDASYEGVDKVTTNAYTLAVNFTPTWFQALPGVDITLPLSYNVGLKGNSAVQLGGNEDSGSYSIGIAADVYQKYKFDLKYVDSFGKFDTCETGTDNNTPGTNGRYQCIPGQITSQAGLAPLLKDRGMVTASFKTTF